MLLISSYPKFRAYLWSNNLLNFYKTYYSFLKLLILFIPFSISTTNESYSYVG